MGKEHFLIEFDRCFIMLCDRCTEEECLRCNLFGDKAKKLGSLDEIEPGDIGFLLNIETDELIGVFRACSQARLHIEADAWNGRFAAQVRVEPIGALQRIKDAMYILGKAGVGMSPLRSGALAPQYPVHPKETAQKILSHFDQPITND